ncbi:hypothetical protein SLS60_001842 [Paraconiothyrium brasiliense]|uniref:Uncharacterized protein n=1 Tax=Paraconiothyrium brasiliense TaxID=300254 RepID=A0ABR3S0N6_9PLEO
MLIRRSVGLFFLFENFGCLASNNFSGHKIEGHFEITRAIWYWNLDKTHSFSRHHRQVMVNFLVASLVAAEGRRYDTRGLFVQRFIEAFINANLRDIDTEEQDDFLKHWYESDFDLITFSNKDMKRIMKKVQNLKEEYPPEPIKTNCFVSEARRHNYLLYCESAAAWAVQWMGAWEKQAEDMEKGEKEDQTRSLKWDTDLCDIMAALGVNEEVSSPKVVLWNITHISQLPAYLTPGHLALAEVQALGKDIEIVSPSRRLDAIPWMDPKAAVNMILCTQQSAQSEPTDKGMEDAPQLECTDVGMEDVFQSGSEGDCPC